MLSQITVEYCTALYVVVRCNSGVQYNAYITQVITSHNYIMDVTLHHITQQQHVMSRRGTALYCTVCCITSDRVASHRIAPHPYACLPYIHDYNINACTHGHLYPIPSHTIPIASRPTLLSHLIQSDPIRPHPIRADPIRSRHTNIPSQSIARHHST